MFISDQFVYLLWISFYVIYMPSNYMYLKKPFYDNRSSLIVIEPVWLFVLLTQNCMPKEEKSISIVNYLSEVVYSPLGICKILSKPYVQIIWLVVIISFIFLVTLINKDKVLESLINICIKLLLCEIHTFVVIQSLCYSTRGR